MKGWLLMWAMAGGLFLAGKWLSWFSAVWGGCRASLGRSIAYFVAWPGMDAKAFLVAQASKPAVSQVSKPATPRHHRQPADLEIGDTAGLEACAVGALNAIGGAALIWMAIRLRPVVPPLLAGWVAMVGLTLVFHFGIFQLLASAWQNAGVRAEPIMRAPLHATSLADFWGRRWNTAFSTLARQFVFKPLAAHWGLALALMSVFLFSGLVHELVISVPARAGYGLPTAYFLLQGTAVLFERSSLGRRIGFGKGIRGWLYVLGCTAGPAFWLFHPAFVRNVILPMLDAIGAT